MAPRIDARYQSLYMSFRRQGATATKAMAAMQWGFPSSHPLLKFASITSAWASPASPASPLAHGPCLQFPNLRLQALTGSWALPQSWPSFMSHLSPFWHPNWSQTLDTWHIINSREREGSQSQVWGCWGLSISLTASAIRGENHMEEGESSETFWEAKVAKGGRKCITFFMAWELLSPCQGSFCGITYFLDSGIRQSHAGGGEGCPCSHFFLSTELWNTVWVSEVGFLFFFPRKIFALFFLNLPQIFTADSNTKQTNQQPKINVLSAGLVVSSMTQQQKQTGRGREISPWYPPKRALLGRRKTHSSRKTSLFLGEQGSPILSPLLAQHLQCIPKHHPRRHYS